MKMLWRIAAFIGLSVLLIFLISLLFDKHLQSEYTITIPAKTEVVFDQLNDLSTWPQWTAWAMNDTGVSIEWSEKTSGEGAAMYWENEDGRGKVIITSSMPDTLIRSHIEVDDWSTVMSTMHLQSTDSGTTVVSWSLSTEVWHPIKRIMGYFIKGWMLRDIKRGLRGLNAWMMENDLAAGKILSIKVYEARPEALHSIIIMDTLDGWPSDSVRQMHFNAIEREIQTHGLQKLFDPYIRVVDTLPGSGRVAMEFGITVEGMERYKGTMKVDSHTKSGIIAVYVGPETQWKLVMDSMRVYANELGMRTEPSPYITFSSEMIDKGLYKGCYPHSFALMFRE